MPMVTSVRIAKCLTSYWCRNPLLIASSNVAQAALGQQQVPPWAYCLVSTGTLDYSCALQVLVFRIGTDSDEEMTNNNMYRWYAFQSVVRETDDTVHVWTWGCIWMRSGVLLTFIMCPFLVHAEAGVLVWAIRFSKPYFILVDMNNPRHKLVKETNHVCNVTRSSPLRRCWGSCRSVVCPGKLPVQEGNVRHNTRCFRRPSWLYPLLPLSNLSLQKRSAFPIMCNVHVHR